MRELVLGRCEFWGAAGLLGTHGGELGRGENKGIKLQIHIVHQVFTQTDHEADF